MGSAQFFHLHRAVPPLGLPGLRTAAPWNPNGGQIWHFADNLSLLLGKHSFKTGLTVMRRNNVFIETLTARGAFPSAARPEAPIPPTAWSISCSATCRGLLSGSRRCTAGPTSSGPRATCRTITRYHPTSL